MEKALEGIEVQDRYHYLNVSFGLLLEGAPPATLWVSILALMAIGAWRFRREFA